MKALFFIFVIGLFIVAGCENIPAEEIVREAANETAPELIEPSVEVEDADEEDDDDDEDDEEEDNDRASQEAEEALEDAQEALKELRDAIREFRNNPDVYSESTLDEAEQGQEVARDLMTQAELEFDKGDYEQAEYYADLVEDTADKYIDSDEEEEEEDDDDDEDDE